MKPVIRWVGGLFTVTLLLSTIGCGKRDDKEWCTLDLLGELDCRYESKSQCLQWCFEGSPYIFCQMNPKYLEPEEPEEEEAPEPEPSPSPSGRR